MGRRRQPRERCTLFPPHLVSLGRAPGTTNNMARKSKTVLTATTPQTTNESNDAPPVVVADVAPISGAEYDAQADLHAEEAVGDVQRDSRGIPVTTQRTLGSLFAEHGIDAQEAALPYFRVKSKPQTIRILTVEPTPPPRAFRDSTITTLARLKVEDDEGRMWLLDVTSARLLSQLASMEDGKWLNISKTGSGMGTMYDVGYAEGA